MTTESPYTRWHGSERYGYHKKLTDVWVNLSSIYIRVKGEPHHVHEQGLDFAGEVPGRLHGWWPTVRGEWLGVVDYEIRYAHDQRQHIRVFDQLVPRYALRPRSTGEHGSPGEHDEQARDEQVSAVEEVMNHQRGGHAEGGEGEKAHDQSPRQPGRA